MGSILSHPDKKLPRPKIYIREKRSVSTGLPANFNFKG